MTTLKHTGTILILVATLGLTSAFEAQAAKNDGRFQQSAEAKHAQICTELKDSYDFNMSYYKEKPGKRGRWKTTAQNLQTLAQGNDCSWAQ